MGNILPGIDLRHGGGTAEDEFLAQVINQARVFSCEPNGDEFEGKRVDGGGVTGGVIGGVTGGYVMGGLDDLSEYDSSVSSSAKRSLIQKLASSVSSALRVKAPSSSSSNSELIKHLLKITPNPSKGRSVIADKGKQAQLCKDAASAINKAYDRKIIDLSLSPDGICNQIADVVETLSAGLNNEYVAVAASVTRNLQNLSDLREMLTRSYDKLYSEAMSSTDEGLRLSAEGIKSVHDLLMQETDRQIAMLTNITNTVIKDTDKDIADLLAKNKDFKGLVSSLQANLGTTEWGDKLGYMLSGVGGLAAVTSAIEKALKIIGLKASEYKKETSLQNLMMKAHEKFESMSKTKVTKEYLQKYYAALDTLRTYHGRHGEISKKLGGSGGIAGGCDACGGGCGATTGGCGCEGYTGGRIKLAKRLKQQSATRKALLQDFRSKAKIHMDRVYQAIFQTGKKLAGGNVPLTDDMYRFKMLMNDLSNVFTEGIEYALTGYYSDSNSTRMREHFLGIIQGMLNTLDSLKSLDSGFRDIASNLEAVVKLMDFYSDKFHAYHSRAAPERKVGAVEDVVTPTASLLARGQNAVVNGLGAFKDAAQGLQTALETKLDGAELAKCKAALAAKTTGGVSGGGEFRAVVSLRNARNAFNHYYNIAKFKKNLGTVSAELKTYNKDYSDIVGVAVGLKVDSERKKIADDITALRVEAVKTAVGGAGTEANRVAVGAAAGAAGIGIVAANEWNIEDIEKIMRMQLSAKEDLYKVAQAVDEYLQKFTDAVATDPDDVQQVAKLLSSVELISNWFSEKSGDAIASLYELFPYNNNGLLNSTLQASTALDASSALPSNIVRTKLGAGEHYYVAVQKSMYNTPIAANPVRNANNINPGDPIIPFSPKRAFFAHQFAKYTCEKVYVLKNIVSAFAYLGQKFGDQDLTKSTFLAPKDIYKGLCKYIYTSAFTWANPTMDVAAAAAGAGGAAGAVVAAGSRYGVRMSAIAGTVNGGALLADSVFAAEDKIFVNIIKSMAAKVFTVTGLYNMMNFSSSGGLRNYALSPTRLVLGGGKAGGAGIGHYSYSTPKIYSEAIELYARLPLLAEFYRNIFCFEEPCDDANVPANVDELLISMVPEVGSMWAGFIETIFDQPLNTNGLYTDNVLKRLIHEINEVFVVYKNRGSKDITSAVISDFVAEINSRYGVMQRSEIKSYRDDENARRRNLNYADKSVPDDDYDILDDDNIGTGIAPSDRYAKANNAYKALDSDYTLDDNVIEALRKFRSRIDKRISTVLLRGNKDGFDKDDYYENDVGQNAIPDFSRIISSTKASFTNVKDAESQFKIVRGMMLGMDVQTQTNVEASVMFHESVVAPLNILTAITHMLEAYVNETKFWDAAALFDSLRTYYAGAGGGVVATSAVMDPLLVDSYRDGELNDVNNRVTRILNNCLRNPAEVHALGYMEANARRTYAQTIGLSIARYGDAPDVANGVHENFTWRDHSAYIQVRWEAVFKHMMNTVYGLTADTNGLCEVNVQGSRLSVNHGGLQSLCEETLAKVRANIDRFRGIIDSSIINKYLGSSNQGEVGSILWVHDHLVSRVFGDVDGNSGIKRAHARVTRAFQLIANVDPKDQSKHVTYYGLNVGAPGEVGAAGPPLRKDGWCVEGVISEMTHYNPVTCYNPTRSGISYVAFGHTAADDTNNFLSGANAVTVDTSNDKFSHLMKEITPDGRSRNWPHPIYKQRVGIYLQEISNNPGYRGAGSDRSRLQLDGTLNAALPPLTDTGAGLQVKFNEVMAQYLGQFWDPTSLKIYAGLIEGPANGPMSNAVFNGQGHPDLVSPGIVADVTNAAALATEINATLELMGKQQVGAPAVPGIPAPTAEEINAITRASGLEGFPDAVLAAGVGGRRTPARLLNSGDPTEVLYASIAKALRTALNETNRSGVKVNIIQSIAEVPMRMKEDMKAQLPVFASMFKLIAKRAELIRSALRLNVGVDRTDMTLVAPGIVSGMRGVYGTLTPSVRRTQAVGMEWNRQWIDKLTSCCDSMITTIRNVMAELNDAPLFFEVNEDSISNFKSRNGRIPVMPLSHLTLVVAPAQKADAAPAVAGLGVIQYRGDLGRTGISGGANDFMFNYGVRLVLNDDNSKPLLDHMPGVSDIVQRYNMVTPSQYQIPEKTYGDFVCGVTMLARYAGQTRMYASIFGADRRIVEPTEADLLSRPMYSYQMKKGLSDSIDITTSTDVPSSFGLMAAHVSEKYKPPVNVSRESSMVYNLLDLNISPINIHAMRREIPLANLYNYAYTFDSFITHIVQSSHTPDLDPGVAGQRLINGNISTHDVLAALCKYPHAQMSQRIFYEQLENIVSGNSTLGFYGYPRFISDQLWSKALFQDTVIGSRVKIPKYDEVQLVNKRRSDRLNIRIASDDWGNVQSYANDATLRYNEKGEAVPLRVTGERENLAMLGDRRFDTVFMRNMFFMANVQRVMLHKINTELTEMKSPVATDLAITNKNLTDARDGQTAEDLYID